MYEEIDAALSAFMATYDDETARAALVATGPAGAQRVFDLYYGGGDGHIAPGVRDRSRGDAWSSALWVAATMDPAQYLARLPRKISTTHLVILGDVDDPRAVEILCEHSGHRDYLHRCNAVRSLAKHHDVPRARAAVLAALKDHEPVVRASACRALSTWDPAAAIIEYETLRRSADLTPLLRQEADGALRDLRAGRPPRDHYFG
ncbi:HEAT repeat domain-containing protein [Catellatospora tritici]|uniref:HEAT repeat domain-containing protein n=1 Tax=Catellatospora tritici TaxID=2851566 RepID=UPI001C2D2BA4|nr:HEAT repeat domain-containing protein [Catellatospora tritici]MBV1850727.1 HEAT repeat domain-containing protein [Catellatospora tritici]MBV1850980.1 HEAT repeat domain-containing protein [Catellatospora tritici]